MIDRGGKSYFDFFDKKVLCFYGYIKHDSHNIIPSDIRKVKIYFYLVDDTMEIIEPKIMNAGLPQGTLLNRHRVRRNPPNDLEFVIIDDFNIGIDITIYSNTYRIVSCDKFTEDFLNRVGFVLNPHEEYPEMSRYKKIINELPKKKNELTSMQRFLKFDKIILNFKIYSIDDYTKKKYFYDLNYYISDQTIEILSKTISSSNVLQKFLKRSLVPKNGYKVEIGNSERNAVLNVVSTKRNRDLKIEDIKKVGLNDQEYLSEKDLEIGKELNIFNKIFVIYDCDTFTRNYYLETYGLEMKANPQEPEDEDFYKDLEVKYPYNGFGSHEDSMANTKGIIPKPVKKDFMKFLLKDRCGQESNILTFMAKMKDDPRLRNFLISFYLADDTISISEIKANGTKCLFHRKERIMKPLTVPYIVDLPEYYESKDFYIGATVKIHANEFVILDTNEYTTKYLVKNKMEPFGDVEKIMEKIMKVMKDSCCEKSQVFKELYNHKGTLMKENDFIQTMTSISKEYNLNLNEQEIKSLAVSLRTEEVLKPDLDRVFTIAQIFFKRSWFDDYKALKETFLLYDADKKKAISVEDATRIIKAIRINIPNNFLEFLLKAYSNEDGLVDIDFVWRVNWKENPSKLTNFPNHIENEWFDYVNNLKPENKMQKKVLIDNFFEYLD